MGMNFKTINSNSLFSLLVPEFCAFFFLCISSHFPSQTFGQRKYLYFHFGLANNFFSRLFNSLWKRGRHSKIAPTSDPKFCANQEVFFDWPSLTLFGG